MTPTPTREELLKLCDEVTAAYVKAGCRYDGRILTLARALRDTLTAGGMTKADRNRIHRAQTRQTNIKPSLNYLDSQKALYEAEEDRCHLLLIISRLSAQTAQAPEAPTPGLGNVGVGYAVISPTPAQGAREVEEIRKRHEEAQGYIDLGEHSAAARLWHHMHQDRAALLRLLEQKDKAE